MSNDLHAIANLAAYVTLDQRVDGGEQDAIRARWEFGRLMLEARRANGGKQLPAGLLARLCDATGKSRAELSYRAQFAALYETPEQVSNALDTWGSWFAIVNEALPRGGADVPALPTADLSCTAADLEAVAALGVRFGTVYADPPWAYGNQATRAATDNHYETMTPEAIAALPIAPLVAEQAHLHLWTTNGFLFEARAIIEAWGFTYKSCFIWAKPQMGIGNYWRVSHEFLLLGVRGDLRFADRSLMSWAEMRRGRHSSKPQQVRDMIERASPGPRLELFGREAAQGWVVWGNEVGRGLFEQDVASLGGAA